MDIRIFLSVCLILVSQIAVSQVSTVADRSHNFKIDSTIKTQVLQNISFRSSSESFTAKINAEFYENDSLVDVLNDTIRDDFFGRYWWRHDTMQLTANIGELGTSGFIADINRATAVVVKHNICSHENRNYKIGLTDTLNVCVEAPCTYTELVISSIPDSMSNEAIYGFVSFKSKDYYYQDNHGLKKLRANMSFYFRAVNFALYLKRHHQ